MELPKTPINNIKINPKLFILYGQPKVGKTSSIAQLENCLIIDLANETDYLKDVNAFGIKVSSLKELFEVGEEIKKQNFPYKYLSIDHLGILEKWCEGLALQYYKRSSIGKNFTGNSVLELSHGAGYYWIRKAFMDCVKLIETWADYVILVGHVREKTISNKVGVEISSIDLELTGQLCKIACAYAPATGYLYRKTIGVKEGQQLSELWISFKASAELTAGSRCQHLRGMDMKFEWDKIYV